MTERKREKSEFDRARERAEQLIGPSWVIEHGSDPYIEVEGETRQLGPIVRLRDFLMAFDPVANEYRIIEQFDHEPVDYHVLGREEIMERAGYIEQLPLFESEPD